MLSLLVAIGTAALLTASCLRPREVEALVCRTYLQAVQPLLTFVHCGLHEPPECASADPNSSSNTGRARVNLLKLCVAMHALLCGPACMRSIGRGTGQSQQ
jgi:hypothetical protein